MTLPFTAYLGEPADGDLVSQCTRYVCSCPECETDVCATDGQLRMFPYGEQGALAAFVACPQCGVSVIFVLIGDDTARRTIGLRLYYESDPAFDPARLKPLPRQFTREGINQAGGGPLRRIDCPECAGAIPVITDDFADARELYTGLPGVAYLFNAPCPWCSAFFYKAVGSPKAVDALYRAIEADEARRRQLH